MSPQSRDLVSILFIFTVKLLIIIDGMTSLGPNI